MLLAVGISSLPYRVLHSALSPAFEHYPQIGSILCNFLSNRSYYVLGSALLNNLHVDISY